MALTPGFLFGLAFFAFVMMGVYLIGKSLGPEQVVLVFPPEETLTGHILDDPCMPVHDEEE